MGEAVKFKVSEGPAYTIVAFSFDRPIEPKQLQELKPPFVEADRGVVLYGRGPIWLYCFLSHYYHYCKFVAVYNPRLGAVITESHTPLMREGDILKVEVK